jgi:hypothetical protein
VQDAGCKIHSSSQCCIYHKYIMVALERKNVIFIQAAICQFFKRNRRVRKERVAFYQKKLHKMQSAVHCFSCHHRFLKGEKGMIKFQAVYQMANVLFFTHNQKEIRELVVKVLEARVKHVHSCCTARKEYNLNLLYRFFQAIKTLIQSQTSERVEHYQHQLILLSQKNDMYRD